MRTFVMGDVHGAYKGMQQCIKRCDFKPGEDRLIFLGDICDGYPDVHLCMDLLISLDAIFVLGNHDAMLLTWIRSGEDPHPSWDQKGGKHTKASYPKGAPKAHKKFLKKAYPYWEEKGRLCVHAGFNPDVSIKKQPVESLYSGRDLINSAYEACSKDKKFRVEAYKEVFVGHTPTFKFEDSDPICFGNLWDLDTGAGWGGPVTIMDINTHEYWQSDFTEDLYPDIIPREEK